MKEIFIEKDFGTEARSMIERVNGILEDYRSQETGRKALLKFAKTYLNGK